MADGERTNATVRCPSGSFATGGGFETFGANAYVAASEPIGSGGWYAAERGDSAGDYFDVYVVCAAGSG
jgi:hypothetical protein